MAVLPAFPKYKLKIILKFTIRLQHKAAVRSRCSRTSPRAPDPGSWRVGTVVPVPCSRRPAASF